MPLDVEEVAIKLVASARATLDQARTPAAKNKAVMRDNGPSIHVSKSADRIVDQCCEAGTLAETKSKSKSCPSRAAIGQVTAARVASEHHSRVKRA
jgi:hypothetical protein